MRIGGSYLGAAVISASVAVILAAWGLVDPTMPHGPIQVPGALVAFSPDFAIQARRADAFLAAAGPEVLVPLRLVATVFVFLVLNVAALVLFEATDDAWRGVGFWESGKAVWAAFIFAAMGSALYAAAVVWEISPLPRLGLPPIGFALAALAGGLAFGFGNPRREPLED